MSFLLYFHSLLTLSAAALIWLWRDLEAAKSFAAGGAVIFFSFVVSVVFWPLVLRKKLIALSVSVIVFKFAILAWILKVVATGKSIQLGWFSGGLALVVVSALATAVWVSTRPEESEL
jgi:hypothetical protein